MSGVVYDKTAVVFFDSKERKTGVSSLVHVNGGAATSIHRTRNHGLVGPKILAAAATGPKATL